MVNAFLNKKFKYIQGIKTLTNQKVCIRVFVPKFK